MNFSIRLLGSIMKIFGTRSDEDINNGYPLGHPLVVILGVLSLVLFLLSRFWTGAMSEIKVQSVFILLFLGGIFVRKWQWRSDVIVYFIMFSIALPLIFFSINYYLDSESALQYFGVDRLFVLTGFSALGYWIGGTLKNIYIFLVIVFIGLVTSLFNVDVISSFSRVLSFNRVSFGLNPNIQGMLFGLSIIAFIAFSNNFLSFRCRRPYKAALSVLYMSSFLLSLVVFFGSQGRSTMLSLALLLVVLIAHTIVKMYKGNTFSKNKGRLSILVFLSIVFFVVSSYVISARGTGEEVKKLFGTQSEIIPMTSFGIRVNLWVESIKWIKKKPLHGWGGRADEGVIEKFNQNVEANKVKVFHLHNSYIELIVSYGLIGLAFLLYIFYFLNRKIFQLSQSEPKYKGVWNYTYYGSLFMLLNNFTDSFLFLGGGIYAIGVLLAPSYTLYLSSVYNKIEVGSLAKS